MKKNLLPILIFIITAVLYFITSAGKTPYDYFTRLADAFIAGRYWLTENPPWLSELIPAGLNKFYVVYPPMPAIIALPFVYFFGSNFPQQIIAHLLGAGSVVLTMAISWQIKKDKLLAVWSGILIGLGSIVWFLSATGSSWYLGQITAFFFLLLALYESLTDKNPWKTGVFFGAAFLARINTIVSFPLYYYLLKNKAGKFVNVIKFAAGFFLFGVFYLGYNYIRFKTPFENGYFLLPQVLNETDAPWFIHGVISPLYIIENFKVLFFSLPKILGHFPYIQPSWAGLSILITTPAFIYSLRAPWKDNGVKVTWLTIILSFLTVALHGGTGFAQFGYRFAVDFYPFLTFLTIKGIAKTGLKWHHWLLLIFGVTVNLWGVLWINKFGWVGW